MGNPKASVPSEKKIHENVYGKLLSELNSSELKEPEKEMIRTHIQSEQSESEKWLGIPPYKRLTKSVVAQKPQLHFYALAFSEQTSVRDTLGALIEANLFMKLLKEHKEEDNEKIKRFSDYFIKIYLTPCSGRGEKYVSPFTEEKKGGCFTEKPINLSQDEKRIFIENQLRINSSDELMPKKIQACKEALQNIVSELVELLKTNFPYEITDDEADISRILSVLEIAGTEYFKEQEVNQGQKAIIVNDSFEEMLKAASKKQIAFDEARKMYERPLDLNDMRLIDLANKQGLMTPTTPKVNSGSPDGLGKRSMSFS